MAPKNPNALSQPANPERRYFLREIFAVTATTLLPEVLTGCGTNPSNPTAPSVVPTAVLQPTVAPVEASLPEILTQEELALAESAKDFYLKKFENILGGGTTVEIRQTPPHNIDASKPFPIENANTGHVDMDMSAINILVQEIKKMYPTVSMKEVRELLIVQTVLHGMIHAIKPDETSFLTPYMPMSLSNPNDNRFIAATSGLILGFKVGSEQQLVPDPYLEEGAGDYIMNKLFEEFKTTHNLQYSQLTIDIAGGSLTPDYDIVATMFETIQNQFPDPKDKNVIMDSLVNFVHTNNPFGLIKFIMKSDEKTSPVDKQITFFITQLEILINEAINNPSIAEYFRTRHGKDNFLNQRAAISQKFWNTIAEYIKATK